MILRKKFRHSEDESSRHDEYDQNATPTDFHSLYGNLRSIDFGSASKSEKIFVFIDSVEYLIHLDNKIPEQLLSLSEVCDSTTRYTALHPTSRAPFTYQFTLNLISFYSLPNSRCSL